MSPLKSVCSFLVIFHSCLKAFESNTTNYCVTQTLKNHILSFALWPIAVVHTKANCKLGSPIEIIVKSKNSIPTR